MHSVHFFKCHTKVHCVLSVLVIILRVRLQKNKKANKQKTQHTHTHACTHTHMHTHTQPYRHWLFTFGAKDWENAVVVMLCIVRWCLLNIPRTYLFCLSFFYRYIFLAPVVVSFFLQQSFVGCQSPKPIQASHNFACEKMEKWLLCLVHKAEWQNMSIPNKTFRAYFHSQQYLCNK